MQPGCDPHTGNRRTRRAAVVSGVGVGIGGGGGGGGGGGERNAEDERGGRG